MAALPEINNFVMSRGDNAVLEFIVTTGSIQTNGTEVSFAVYEQLDAVPSSETPLFEKLMDYGIEIDHEDGVTTFYVELEKDDTQSLALGNYYYEAKIVDGDGKNITASVGLVTLTGLSTSLSIRSIKLRFPELATIDDYIVDFALAMATFTVGSEDNWIEDDVVSARMFLTAHLITQAQSAAEGTDGRITSQSIGRLSESYSSSSVTDRVIQLETTAYGRRYLQLMRASHGGPVVI